MRKTSRALANEGEGYHPAPKLAVGYLRRFTHFLRGNDSASQQSIIDAPSRYLGSNHEENLQNRIDMPKVPKRRMRNSHVKDAIVTGISVRNLLSILTQTS